MNVELFDDPSIINSVIHDFVSKKSSNTDEKNERGLLTIKESSLKTLSLCN